jgi:hypothetical protein
MDPQLRRGMPIMSSSQNVVMVEVLKIHHNLGLVIDKTHVENSPSRVSIGDLKILYLTPLNGNFIIAIVCK